MMNTDQLNAFLFVARHRSFARAARELGISDRLISRQIKRLEEKVGVRLVERDTRFRGLTAKGEAFALFVERWMDALEAACTLAMYETFRETAVQGEIGPPLHVLEAEDTIRRFRQEFAAPADARIIDDSGRSGAGEAAKPL